MKIKNYVNNEWLIPLTDEFADVINPATGELITQTPMCGEKHVDEAVHAAQTAFYSWRRTPVEDRIQYLFKLRDLLLENQDEIARTITIECGKTFEESKAEMVRAVENVEVACGMPMMMKGDLSEDIALGIDEIMIRQPLGVCATIAPFNFPGMIVFWYLPYALAAGNTYLVKPSERVPMTMQIIFKLIEKAGFPAGVVNMVNGGRNAADAILKHKSVKAVTFVGSTKVAKHIYKTAAENGKRVQAQGGAKNPAVIMPDADMDTAAKIITDSAFGCAGQRCLAVSYVITVGEANEKFIDLITSQARDRIVGNGLDKAVQMGPVISKQSKNFIEETIQNGIEEGANLLLDGRAAQIPGCEMGYFINPTIFSNVKPGGVLWSTEIFGPVLSIIQVDTLDQAIEIINQHQYGNQASIFSSSGAAARKFRYEVQAGNIGVNIGVAAPMAFFPFSGWKDSFFGSMHGQAMDAVEFFTQKKVVIERWPKDWTRKF